MRCLLKIGVPTVLALTGASAFVPATRAQAPAAPSSAFSAGVFLPRGHGAGTRTLFAAEVRHALSAPVEQTTRTVISLGLEIGSYHHGDSFFDDSGTTAIIPLSVSQIVSLNGRSPLAPGAVFAGAGAGAYTTVNFGAGIKLGADVELGANVSREAFLDAKYQFSDRADGLSASLGFRF